MKRLSRLNNSQQLLVFVNDEFHYIIKEDLMSGNSYSMNEIEKIYTVVPDVAEFDLELMIHIIGNDMNAYDGWTEDVYKDLMSYPETHTFLNIVNEVLKLNKIYTPEDEVIIDIEF